MNVVNENKDNSIEDNNKQNFEELISQAKILEILEYDSEKNITILLGQIASNYFILKLKKIFYEKSPPEIWSKLIQTIKSPKLIHDTDIYKKFIAVDNISNLNNIEFIYPVSEKIIEKNRIKKGIRRFDRAQFSRTAQFSIINHFLSQSRGKCRRI